VRIVAPGAAITLSGFRNPKLFYRTAEQVIAEEAAHWKRECKKGKHEHKCNEV
jgi:hypothetical protein